jgi:hypothetical protein
MAEFQDAFKKVKKYGQAAAGLGRGLMSTVGTSGGRAFQQGVSAIQGPLFQAGTQMYGQMQPMATGMQYIPPSPVGQLGSNQPIPAVPQGQRLELMPATSANPRSLQESALRVSRFSQIPQAFQQRFQERQASGLNQGFTEQDAVNYYNQNYLSRGRGLQPDAGMASYGPSALMPPPQTVQQPMQSQSPSFANMSLAAQLEQQRLSGQGMFAGPTPQERAQFGADVQQQIQQNPSPVNQFMDQEMMGRTREGQRRIISDLEQEALDRLEMGQPRRLFETQTSQMDRQNQSRLNSLIDRQNQRARDIGAESRQTGAAIEQAVYDQLARQGMSPQRLSEIASLPVAEASRVARASIAPGTVIRGMGSGGVPFTIVRGPEEDSARREARLASLPARRERDRAAVRDRLANMRLGRQTMAANQLAAQQRAIDMATNPLVNPMLVANSPSALAAVFQTQQGQRDFMANAPMRQAELNAQRLQNRASEMMMTPEYRDEQRRNSAIQAFGLLTPEQQNGPIGRYLQSQIVPQTSPPGSVSGPQSIEEASGTVEAIAPSVARILGSDPGSFNPRQILMEIDRRASTRSPIQGADLDSIVQYIINRSKADPEYVPAGVRSGAIDELIRSGRYVPGSITQENKNSMDEMQSNYDATSQYLLPSGGVY